MLTFNLYDFWARSDAISHAVLVILLVLSVSSWSVIFAKGWRLGRVRWLTTLALNQFWAAPRWETGLVALRKLPLFAHLAHSGWLAVRHQQQHCQGQPHLDAALPLSDAVTRALRQTLHQAHHQLESGQTLLASVGSTAPFIGLLGTVWGIYHALAQIGLSGQASLEQVAGPVGEALIMTAIGLFTAIPAVLAFNAFNRTQRVILAELDAFAYDLHAYFTTGQPLCKEMQPTAEATSHRAVMVAEPV
jgi:biopolymer transport protein ExbB